jgi:hypothetical protein
MVTRLLPPYEIKGRGMPVKGTKATIEAIFKNACPPIQAVIPVAKTFEKESGAFFAMVKPLNTKKTNNIITLTAPIRPNSSAMTAKIESVEASGRNKYFCLEAPNPTPKIPPDPRPNRT